MKPVLLLASLLAMVVVTLAHPDVSDSWNMFKEKFGKQYESEEEESYRQTVWEENKETILSHNSEDHSYSLGENEFSDMTSDEFVTFFNGLSTDGGVKGGKMFRSDVAVADLPSSVNWTAAGYTTPVKNQLQCGSCWAFSSTGSLEGQWFKKYKKLVSLSEQNLVDCSAKQGNHGCGGGLMDFAFKYVKLNGGIDTEASYPYTAKTGKVCKYNVTNKGANLTSWVDIPTGSEQDLQKAVATIGPVSVGIDAHLPTFQHYKRGVYHDKHCSSHRLDHGVLVVGYGVEQPEENEEHKAKDYWIVKNSWGPSWGDHGYLKMARNKKNACGIATAAVYPVV
jgi:cathepsin L